MDTTLHISDQQHCIYRSTDLRHAILTLYKDSSAVALTVMTCLLTISVIVEGFVSFQIKGLHLMVDSLHNVLNILALIFSITAMTLGKLPGNDRFTYGYLRLGVISAFAQCCFLAFWSLFLVFRAIHDLLESLDEEGEHNHATGSQRFDLLLQFNGMRLAIYLLGTVLLRNFSSLYPDPKSDSGLFTRVLCKIIMKPTKKDEDNYRTHRRYASSHYMNVHTIYLHFLIGTLIAGTFVAMHYIEFLHQSGTEIIFAIGLLVYTINRIKPVVILASDVLLQALPELYETNITRQLEAIKSTEGVVKINKSNYWALASNYAVIYLTLTVTDAGVKDYVDQEVRAVLQEHFAEILIEIKCGKNVKQI